ncbi:hypothetical protein HZY97_16270 [Sphingomonas sp. R-74633]|uniref:hypothetical protein n=1 Tax=Sphingomonas sp. R-74633 TaxID=2751188 RepID=UPI0015D1A246|nr:hypothetical protein [Sphingomonas sp. R-74633]NYT42329.1 hypothetical protein [Sphingomonas sp. R-74633]
MSARQCILDLFEQGKLDREQRDRYTGELDRLEAAYRKRFSAGGAAEMASAELVDRLGKDAAETRRQTLLQLSTQKSVLEGLVAHVKGGGKAGQYAIALFDHHEAIPGVSNISNRHAALRQLAWSRMGDYLLKFGRGLDGRLRNSADALDMVRELFGQSTGNADARELAQAFRDTADWLRQMFNAAGGHIAKLDGWGLPQAHDAISVARAGFETWRDFIRPLLDPARMIDGATGRSFDDAGLGEALEGVWRSISSEGLDKLEPGQMVGSKLANQRADSRFLVFKDADSWIAYHERFGAGDPFNAITGHIDGITKDISSMQVLGPNAGLTVRWLGDMLRKGAAPTIEGGRTVKLEAAAAKAARETDRMWRFYRGELTMPEPTDRGVARFFSGLRNWNVATKLGGAFLSAFGTDPVFAAMTAKFNGLDTTKVMGAYLRGFNPLDAGHRAAAVHAGLVFNEMTARAERLWREDTAMRVNVHEVSRRLADGVLRGSLLSPHTVSMKQATGLGFMMDFARHADKSFERLDAADQARFARYGIDAADWDYIRATPVTEEGGYKLLRPGDVASREDGFKGPAMRNAMKLFEMIDSETKFATPGELLRAQTMLALGGKGTAFQRGTILGEVAHSATQFKTYSVIALMTHMQRAIYGNGGVNRATYALMLPLFLTLGGAMVLQLKSIAAGKDPEPMTGAKFWGRAFIQGGGAGMLGDFVTAGLAGRSRTGGTLAGYIAGPTMSGLIDPAMDLVLGNLGKGAEGKKTTVQHELVQLAENNIPGMSTWYLSTAAHRAMLDQLNRSIDPNYQQSWKRMEHRAAEQGSQYWWAPGDPTPDRAPNFENAMQQGGNQP